MPVEEVAVGSLRRLRNALIQHENDVGARSNTVIE
jgi:hypothetical protein